MEDNIEKKERKKVFYVFHILSLIPFVFAIGFAIGYVSDIFSSGITFFGLILSLLSFCLFLIILLCNDTKKVHDLPEILIKVKIVFLFELVAFAFLNVLFYHSYHSLLSKRYEKVIDTCDVTYYKIEYTCDEIIHGEKMSDGNFIPYCDYHFKAAEKSYALPDTFSTEEKFVDQEGDKIKVDGMEVSYSYPKSDSSYCFPYANTELIDFNKFKNKSINDSKNQIKKCFQDDIEGDFKGVNLFLSIFIAITALLMFVVKDEMKKYPTTLKSIIIME